MSKFKKNAHTELLEKLQEFIDAEISRFDFLDKEAERGGYERAGYIEGYLAFKELREKILEMQKENEG